MARSVPAIAALALFLPLACGRTDAAARDSIEGLRLMGVQEEMRIGDVNDPDLGFSRVGGLGIDRDGNLFISEGTSAEIRVYSPEGKLLRRIGRRGDGPGEFTGAPRFGLVGDTLWTLSSNGTRLALFHRSGALLSTGRTDGIHVLLPESGLGTILPRGMRPDGKFTGWFSRVSYSRDRPASGLQPTDRIPWPFVLFDPSGAVTDTIGWASRPPPRMWRPPSEDDLDFRFIEVGGRRMIAPSPPTALPEWVDLPDGYIVIHTPPPTDAGTATMTVTRIGLEGDTVYSRALRYAPQRYESAELDSIAYRAARGEVGGFVPVPALGAERPPIPENLDEVARGIRAEMRFPELKLPIEQSWLAQDGTLWLQRMNDGSGLARWVLLDDNGLPRSELRLPANVRVLWASGDRFWAVVPDDLEVPWIVRYRITDG
jgi:hypothetical protein